MATLSFGGVMKTALILVFLLCAICCQCSEACGYDADADEVEIRTPNGI